MRRHYWLLVCAVIGLGSVLAGWAKITYTCSGPELFPNYYASPFIYSRDFLGSSLTWEYSILGLMACTLVHGAVFGLLYLLMRRISVPGVIVWARRVLVGCLFSLSLFFIYVSYSTTPQIFGPDHNYWYWDMRQEAATWGVQCEPSW